MQCAHCLEHFTTAVRKQRIEQDRDAIWVTESSLCAACNRMNAFLGPGEVERNTPSTTYRIKRGEGRRVYPEGTSRPPLPGNIPAAYAALYNEAAAILDISPRASGALSRRCLQQL